METSVFVDKSKAPTNKELKGALGNQFDPWDQIRDYVFEHYPDAAEEWSYSKFGWNYRIKDKKRAIIYFMPCDGFFKVSFVFGEKAATEALASSISKEIKNTIKSAKVYAEGRGFRVDVKSCEVVADVKKLIDVKLSH